MNKIKNILSGFASDNYSFNDYLSVSSFFRKKEHDQELKKHLKEAWDKTETELPDKNLIRLLDKLHHQIALASYSPISSFQKFYRSFSKVAAVLLLPAIITISILSYLSIDSFKNDDVWAELHSPVGARTKFHLPDGSEGWLNGGSSIKYPIHFKNDRVVKVSGEVWFDVVSTKKRSFVVETPYFDVKVLGTIFNVIAYDYEETAEVILEQGKVCVLDKDQKVKSNLMPDQHFIYNGETGFAQKKEIDSKKYTSWKDGLLIFKDEPMSEIARRLSRKYNAEIVLHGDALKSLVFRATFQDESLEEIFELLATVIPIEYEIKKRDKQSDETFARTRIDVRQKK